METNFVPQGNKVLVLPNPTEEKTKSGIIIPDTARKKAFVGKVVSTGEGYKEYPMTVKKGDTVLYSNNYVEIKLDDVEYLLMNEQDIIGICG